MIKMLAINPKSPINAAVDAPPSKSYTNRALLIAALADGTSVLRNPLLSGDTQYMISALREFGIKIEARKKEIIVHGTRGRLNAPKRDIFVGNAGTAMRFLITVASLADGDVKITGDKRMLQRPVRDLIDGLSQAGVKCESSDGFPPVTIHGGSFRGGKIKMKGDVSSQYVSSLLMCAPYSMNGLEIEIEGDLASKPYVEITIDIMNKFGVDIQSSKFKTFAVRTNKFFEPKDYAIEGDASNASYFLAAAAVTKGKVRVSNLNPDSKQGDIRFAGLLEKMGCKVTKGRDCVEVVGGKLKSIDVDMNKMPDVVQTLAVVAIFADSATTIRNVPNLRVKETDRLKSLSTELRKLGAEVTEMEDGITIEPKKLQGAIIETYNDHRMAMSFAVAGLGIPGIKIKDPDCVNKSFPDFWKVFGSI